MKSKSQVDANYRSPNEIHTFVKTIETVYMLDRPITGDSDRREFDRLNVTVPVGITPQHQDSQVSNCLHHSISRDISNKGIGLVTTDPIRPGIVLLTIEHCGGESFEVMARITYCNEIGYYFHIGCEFLSS